MIILASFCVISNKTVLCEWPFEKLKAEALAPSTELVFR